MGKSRENHTQPIIRIQKIVLDNFKCIKHGEIVFNCGREFIPQNTEADILGIYGQNGSGKTAVIEAVSILKKLLSGDRIHERYAACVAQDADYAKLEFTFDFQYPDNQEMRRTIMYSFKLSAVHNANDNQYNSLDDMPVRFPYIVRIYDEAIYAAGMFDGEMLKKQEILTANLSNYPIGPVRKISHYIGTQKDKVLIDLVLNKKSSEKESRSFFFLKDTMDIFFNESSYSEYVQVLDELQNYAKHYLYALDSTPLGRLGVIPLETRFGMLMMNALGETAINKNSYEKMQNVLNNINIVLPSLIAGLKIEMKTITIESDGVVSYKVKLYSRRNETIIPLVDESAGVLRLLCILSLIIAVYNDPSCTVAIDEMDAGIYEYLLGEILTGIETYGKGQFIFTSHNLRPLEVLRKEELIFTTTNPERRFMRLKGVGRTNNLRTLYLREILSHTQDEEIYNAANRQRMIAAFLKAGE